MGTPGGGSRGRRHTSGEEILSEGGDFLFLRLVSLFLRV